MDELDRDQSGAAATAGIGQLRDLQSVSEAALAHLSLDDLLHELLDRIQGILAVDTVAVLLLDAESAELVARAAKGLEEEVERGTRIPLGRGFAGTVIAQRRPVVVCDLDRADLLNPLLHEKGLRSLLGVPLLVEGEAIGVLHVGSLSPRDFTEDDVTLLQLVADRAAIAIDHARLYEAERAARQEAGALAKRLEQLQSITEVALAHMALDDQLLIELLARVRGNLEVDTAAILLLDAASNELVARAAIGIEEEVERGVRIPVGGGFAGRIAASAAPVVIEDVHQGDVLNPILREKGIHSLLGVPLLVEGRVIGVLHVGSLMPRRFSSENVTLLQMAADRIAIAVDHVRLFELGHRVAATLQRSLLPESLPRVPGLELAARYRPGQGEAELGGDWYDAIVLPSGRVGVALGDVVARGLRAASVTAQLRNALRAYVLDGHGPAEAMGRLSRLIRSLDRMDMATLVYMEVDADTGTIVASTAGHPPPLVVDRQGRARLLETPRSVPLGALADPRYEEVEAQLEPGSLLLAYTDGLVERRDVWIDEGMERLRQVAEGDRGDVESFCTGVLDAMLRESPTKDDVAMIAFELKGVSETRLVVEFPAEAGELAAMRRALRRWLATAGAEPREAYEMLVATTEAAANSVEHAYGPIDANFRVEAELENGEVRISVIDSGSWRPPRGANRGRGTLLMQELMDTFEVVTGDDGTEVRMRRRLAVTEGGS